MISSTATAAPTQPAMAGLRAEFARLRGADLGALTSLELVELAREFEVLKRQLPSFEHALIAELEARNVAGEFGRRSTADLLVEALRIDPREATGRVRAAAELGPRRALSGEPLPPIFERVAAAQAEGAISPAHARIVTKTIDDLPHDVAAEIDVQVEEFLVEQARQFDPKTLRVITRRLSETVNPDGRGFDDADRARRRAFDVHQNADGTCDFTGRTDAIGGEALMTFLDAAAQPVTDESGQRDPRTAAQRQHDALRDWLLGTIRSGKLPDTGGVAATIVLITDPDQLDKQRGTDGTDGATADPGDTEGGGGGLVRTGHGAFITVDEARTVLGDAQVFTVLHGTKLKRIDAYSDTHRIFTQSQRLAMMSRDLGCSFPGCTVPASWCEANHVTEFQHSRRTSVDDGCLLCGYHHRMFEQLGWAVQMNDGIPQWIPPVWLDPDQKPVRNTAHLPDPPPIPTPSTS